MGAALCWHSRTSRQSVVFLPLTRRASSTTMRAGWIWNSASFLSPQVALGRMVLAKARATVAMTLVVGSSSTYLDCPGVGRRRMPAPDLLRGLAGGWRWPGARRGAGARRRAA